MTRRVWRWLLAALALAPPALFVGLVTAQTVYPFGPHEAVYEVTADSRLTVDLGPIGALVMPSPAPWPVGFLGARVSVGPIPAELASADIPTVATLARDLTEYGQAYLGIDQTLRQAAIGLAADALLRAGIIWSAGLTALVLVLALLGRARRTQLTMWLGRRRVLASGTAVGAAVVGLAVATGLIWSAKPVAEPPAEPLLEGTPLAGAHLTGRLGQL
ncbi:MAG: hypothetical protein LBD70_01565, partial [Bifidobacteriaceae bacterium]|nr:hypothetical protein [Bifidobacteriaceae bacterium]